MQTGFVTENLMDLCWVDRVEHRWHQLGWDTVKSKAWSRKRIKWFGCHLDVNIMRLRIYSWEGWKIKLGR